MNSRRLRASTKATAARTNSPNATAISCGVSSVPVNGRVSGGGGGTALSRIGGVVLVDVLTGGGGVDELLDVVTTGGGGTGVLVVTTGGGGTTGVVDLIGGVGVDDVDFVGGQYGFLVFTGGAGGVVDLR